MQTHGGQKVGQEMQSALPPNALKLRECRCNDDKLSKNATVAVVVVFNNNIQRYKGKDTMFIYIAFSLLE